MASRTTDPGTVVLEGPTDDASVNALRLQHRNFLATLLLSEGVPMIAHGDEIGRTQQGNNNEPLPGQCIGLGELELADWQRDLLAFTSTVTRPTARAPGIWWRRFFAGSADHGGESTRGDIDRLRPSGEPMAEQDWRNGEARTVGVILNGAAIPESDSRGRTITDDDFLIVFNADRRQLFTLPPTDVAESWVCEVDTAAQGVPVLGNLLARRDPHLKIAPRSVLVLRHPRA